MYPLWDQVIAPILEAAGARRVVEIGAFQGETTVKLLHLLGPDAEVHVIDPVPRFDHFEQERRFPGRYRFHGDISHNVLPTLPPMDAALIDGDHNWYTVYNELKMLAATAREADRSLPVLFLHDVGWPYGRRDLYYAPERIPEEFRQPHAQRGMAPGRRDLCPSGGLNAGFHNALREGGQRNGVMTALEDFVAEYDGQLRVVLLPVHFGLAIAASEDRLASTRRLVAALDQLEAAQGRREQAELAESLRVMRQADAATAAGEPDARVDRGAKRYLDVVKAALLNEHHLENEMLLTYLDHCIKKGTAPDPVVLHSPDRWRPRQFLSLQQARRGGETLLSIADRLAVPYTATGRSGLDHLHACLETIRVESIEGDLAACGVWRGGAAIFMRAFLEAHELPGRLVWVLDSFSGSAAAGGGAKPGLDRKRPPKLVGDLNVVREGFARSGLLDERVRFLQGRLADTLADAPIGELALLHIGDELGETSSQALWGLYERLAPGGLVVIDHYEVASCRRAVDRFRRRHGVNAQISRVGRSGASWRKPASARTVVAVPEAPARPLDRAPLAGPAPEPSTELSVVVVFHDMKREAARTLRSLSRFYQREVDDLSYEVIAIENGSSDEQRLGEDFVRSFGPEFRYLDLGPESTPSPAYALNRGIAVTRGESLALMIDGAHVLTPGVLRYGVLGLRTYAPTIVTTTQWYLGPGQQGEAMEGGYDQEYEDRLFNRIRWPTDGYRLFEIGNFIGDRDWFDPLWESNCLFTPRELLEQVGGFDESFSMPGGGYANLDLFERLGSTPGVTVTGILGEASFHQVHGGTTTNQPNLEERHARLMSYREHYERVRKRPFRGPGKPRHYVGMQPSPAGLRTRPRWMAARAFAEAQRLGANGLPERPTPVPEQLQAEFTDAFWRSLAWREVTWLGRRVERAPTDLVAYQELVACVRPDWIVEIGPSHGGAMFFASICELVGCARVLSVRPNHDGEREDHPRITYVTGPPTAEETRRQVFETVGEGKSALVVMAPGPLDEIVSEFRAYSPLVGVGSYAIVEGTIVNGHPVLPGYGPGPSEAIQMLLRERRDFAPDHHPERFGLTFNPRGFLKRVE
jgi:cephalosporin hydroxylase